PRAASAAWGVLGACVVLGQFGALLSLPKALIDLSPFGHVPAVGNVTAGALALLTVVALVLACAGLVGLHRRDIG
ncbi:MAG: ABC transporter permease, partial [Geodermatophilaceae bacterium]|nr:ABC transporter permease [Geodermatophilaceae bacterium]